MLSKEVPDNLEEMLQKTFDVNKTQATRASSGSVIQGLADILPEFIGGSADLGPSNKTAIKKSGSFSAECRDGRNIHFGVRELAMSFIANGMALFGTAHPYCASFFVFSDYMKPGIRLAALMQLPVIYVLTHDSFYVGEDGPTHEPIEQLAMLRSTPEFTVIRPADANETVQAWAYAVRSHGPVALVLTRQDIENVTGGSADGKSVSKGAYILSDEADFETILIATGSEVSLAMGAARILRENGKKVRVVSMPSWELFEKQSEEYRESVLPANCVKRVSIEAASTFGWRKYTGDKGLNLGLDHFGASAP